MLHTNTLLAAWLLVSGVATAGTTVLTPSLQQQAEEIPAEFADRLFTSPQASRVELNGAFLGDALLVLSRDGRVQLLQFSDSGPQGQTTLQTVWQYYLSEAKPLGDCKIDCPHGLLSMHYSVENATLYLLSQYAESNEQTGAYVLPPEAGSQGMIARSQLNLAGAQQGGAGGRYALDMSGSLGNWTGHGGALLSRSSGMDAGWRHALTQLYTQREYAGNYLRLGYFTPDNQHMVLLPRPLAGSGSTTLGVMAGSSTTLRSSHDFSSSYPIYVTANRDGMVEVLRNGVLLHSQPVSSGLQLINTRTLPEGVYQVEVRLLQDGVLHSTQTEWIYKSPSWGSAEQRWRYNLFAGQQRKLLDNFDNSNAGEPVWGGNLNYLVHPQLVAGINVARTGQHGGHGASVAVDFNSDSKLIANWLHSGQYGNQADLQWYGGYGEGSVLLGLSQWRQSLPDGGSQPVRTVNLTWQQQLGRGDSLSARLSHGNGQGQGVGLDLGLSRRQKLWGSDLAFRLSMFDRPYGGMGGQRSRGVELSLNLDFASEGRSLSATLGSRNSGGSNREQYAGLTLRQRQDASWLQQYGIGLNADRYGLGVTGDVQWRHALAQGDAYLARAAQGGRFSGGVNVESTLALNGQAVALSADGVSSAVDTAVIVDVASDIPDLTLYAEDTSGGHYTLHQGRNLLPASPYRPGKFSFYFAERDATAASISPAQSSYHLNKGGVDYVVVNVRKIVTLAGRLQDADGRPLAGAAVINHAGRTMSDSDGFFSVDVSASQPELEIKLNGQRQCLFKLAANPPAKAQDVQFVGDIRCEPLSAQHTTDTASLSPASRAGPLL
jgi:Mat/Ecp fimbriae outer membrane usher protein